MISLDIIKLLGLLGLLGFGAYIIYSFINCLAQIIALPYLIVRTDSKKKKKKND